MTTSSFDPEHRDVGRHLTSGMLNSGVAQAVKVGCQFVSVIALARLLTPSDFGVIAMAGPVTAFVSLFQDLGLSQVTIQKKGITHDEVNAFFWLNILVGLALTLFLIAVSPLVGMYYQDDRVIALTAATSSFVILGSLGGQVGALLQRKMAFGLIARFDVLSALGGTSVAILLSYLYRSYWALFFGNLVTSFIIVGCTWHYAAWRPTWPKHVAGLKSMMLSGAGMTSANFTGFLSRNLDNILLGRFCGDIVLGLYDRAYKLLLFPIQRIVWPLTGIMVPILSHLQDDPEQYRKTILRTLGQLLLAVWPGIIWAVVLREDLIPTVLGKEWNGVIPLFAPLAIAALIQILNSPIGWLLVSQGRMGTFAKWGAIGAAGNIIAFAVGLPFGGLGVAIAYAASEALKTPFLWRSVTRVGPVQLRQACLALFPLFLGGGTSILVLMAYQQFAFDNVFVSLGVGLCLSYLSMVMVLAIFPSGRAILEDSWKVALRLITKVIGKNKG